MFSLKNNQGLARKRIYLPENFNGLQSKSVSAALDWLTQNPPEDFQSARTWFGYFHEFSCAITEIHSRLELDTYLHMGNLEVISRLESFEKEIMILVMNAREVLTEIYLKSPWVYAMHGDDRGRIQEQFLKRKNLNSAKIAQLQLQEAEIVRQFKQLSAVAEIDVNEDGKKTAISVLSSQMNSHDPDIRKKAFSYYWKYWHKNEEIYQDLFTKLLKIRAAQSEVANTSSYEEFAYLEMGRTDLTPALASEFRHSILALVPLIFEKIIKPYHEDFTGTKIQPWNMSVCPTLTPVIPLGGKKELLLPHLLRLLEKVHPSFAKIIQGQIKKNHVDIFSRHQKAPGAFCVHFHESGDSYLFANVEVSLKDILTVLHEIGHVIHGAAVAQIPNILLRHPGFEFAEFASIGMECLATQHFKEIWEDEKEAAKAKKLMLSQQFSFWPFMAMLDEWQHRVYNQPHDYLDPKKRNELWSELSNHYRPYIDWSEFPHFKELGWMSRMHVFASPFYYIDYGIAQVGTLQLLEHSQKNYNEAVNRYIKALSLGGSRSLSGLYEEAGVKLDLSENFLKTLFLRVVNGQFE